MARWSASGRVATRSSWSPRAAGVVSALAVDPDGQAVVALRQTEHSSILSCSLRRPDGTFRTGPDGQFRAILASWLTPVLPWGPDWLVGLGHGRDLLIVDAASWMSRSGLSIAPRRGRAPHDRTPDARRPDERSGDDRLVVLTHDGPCWVLFDSGGRELDRTESDQWCPANPAPRPLRCVPVTWTPGSPFVELIGLDKDGAVYVSEFRVEDGRLDVSSSRAYRTDQTYLAATRFGSGSNTVVAVSRTRIDWLSLRTDRFQPARIAAEPEPLHGGRVLLPELPRGDPGGLRRWDGARIDSPRRRSQSS